MCFHFLTKVFFNPHNENVSYISTLLIKRIIDMYKLMSCFYLSNIIITLLLHYSSVHLHNVLNAKGFLSYAPVNASVSTIQ